MSVEKLDQLTAHKRDYKRRRNREKTRARLAEAGVIIRTLQQRGLTYKDIAAVTGCNRNNLSKLVNGSVSHVTDATMAKLQAGYRQEVTA